MATRSAAEAPQDTPVQYRDASGRRKDTPDGYMDLEETHGWGLWIFTSLADVSLLIRDFYDNIKLSLDTWIQIPIKRVRVRPLAR